MLIKNDPTGGDTPGEGMEKAGDLLNVGPKRLR